MINIDKIRIRKIYIVILIHINTYLPNTLYLYGKQNNMKQLSMFQRLGNLF